MTILHNLRIAASFALAGVVAASLLLGWHSAADTIRAGGAALGLLLWGTAKASRAI